MPLCLTHFHDLRYEYFPSILEHTKTTVCRQRIFIWFPLGVKLAFTFISPLNSHFTYRFFFLNDITINSK